MTCTNTVLFYVEKSGTTKEFMDQLMNALGDSYYEDYSEDGVEYYRFRVTRPNHFSMSNGTVTKIEFIDPLRTIEQYANDIKHFVDNIV